MAIDLQVVFPQELVNLSSVKLAEGLAVRTLDVIGDDFRSVAEVLVNGTESPSIVIASRTRMLVQVPISAAFQRITSISVVKRQLTLSPRSVIKFQIGKSPSKVRGILRLMQVFLKILFTTPGSDIFSPRMGGGGLKNLGRSTSSDGTTDIVADFVVAVSTTSKQILSIQSRDPSIPRDERLLKAKVTRAAFDTNESALIVSVELTSQAGRAATANVTM